MQPAATRFGSVDVFAAHDFEAAEQAAGDRDVRDVECTFELTLPQGKYSALTRAQKLSKALKACKRDKQKAKRASCEKAARKRFGPVKKAKKK